MTPVLASPVLVTKPLDGRLAGRAAVHLSRLQAVGLGLTTPGQLLRGVITSRGLGAALQFAGVTVPLPEHAYTDSAGTFTAQALLTRDGWILRPLAEELPEPIQSTMPLASPAITPGPTGVQTIIPKIPNGLLAEPVSFELPKMTHSTRSPGSITIDTWTQGIAVSDTPTAPDPLNASVALARSTAREAFLPELYAQDSIYRSLSDDPLVHPPPNWLGLLSTTRSTQQADSTVAVGADGSIAKTLLLAPKGDGVETGTSNGLSNTRPPNALTLARLKSLTGLSPIAAPSGWAEGAASATAQPTRPWRFSSLIPSLSGVNLVGSQSSFTHLAPDTILAMEPTGELIMLGIDPAAQASRPILPTPDANPVRMTDPVARDLGLRDGEVIKGTVKADGDALKLILKGLPIELPEGHGLQAGDTPTFRVFQSPEGLLLQPLRAPTAAQLPLAPIPTAMAPPLAGSNLMSLLLHPNGLAALTQLMSSGLLDKALSALNAPELTTAMRQGRPSMSRLTSTGLRKAVAGSGLWTEASLTQSKGPAANDTKLLLLNLLKSSAGDPDIKGALGRGLEDIESAQLQAVQAQTNHELLLNMVIPFSDANPVRLSFHRPAPSREQPDPPYTVNLHSHNDFLGEIWLKTAITDKTQVSMTMWARLPEVATAASKGSRALSMELERAGLKMNSFVVYNGARQDPVVDGTPPGAIVNVQA